MKLDSALPQLVNAGVANGTAYAVYGTGQPLVFIHGVGMAKVVWAPQIATFAAQHQVIVYDMLGHGDSKLPPEGATLEMYAQQLTDLLDHLKIKAATVVGHSMGALIALEFAIRNPERTIKVAALNAVYARSAEQRKAVMQRAETLDKIGIAATVDSTMERWFGNSVPAALVDAAELVHTLLRSINSLGYARTYHLFARSDQTHVHSLPGLKTPALFMTGECDLNSSPEMSAAMATVTPGSELVVIPGARHMMNLTAPVEVNRHLSTFINI
ncbi:Pimeloyl-ACP methyl ester carboxylesterase [Collimonas sp. OK607]|uniref:alpha/beta fold hydrolase n=1 Tax=Collimonas sp. OK607 TaxID=1798194 RepID=UPI0008E50274|nr:alpha/beta fold hydrolase [Collimonas sp. OK607]SFA95143.1 Pimeloyl-ACP methyl ester carboxylesterase [Collimonas sp. OK607]